MATAGAYLVIFVAEGELMRVPYLSRFGDLSYGIYIWAFPVQQMAAQFWSNSNWLINGLASMPFVLVLAALSWRFIEKPALSLKAGSSFAQKT
jgi:peptidoglycan/LPS O-acetylase OafA/YrhL